MGVPERSESRGGEPSFPSWYGLGSGADEQNCVASTAPVLLQRATMGRRCPYHETGGPIPPL
jgi:hypothetical protein